MAKRKTAELGWLRNALRSVISGRYRQLVQSQTNTNLTEDLSMPFVATYGFLLTLGLMLAVIVTGILMLRKRRQKVKASAEEPAYESGAMPSAGD